MHGKLVKSVNIRGKADASGGLELMRHRLVACFHIAATLGFCLDRIFDLSHQEKKEIGKSGQKASQERRQAVCVHTYSLSSARHHGAQRHKTDQPQLVSTLAIIKTKQMHTH